MTKLIIFLFFMALVNTAQAQIFECVGVDGSVVYQDVACSGAGKQKKVIVQKFDPEKILDAQKKLNTEIQRQQELKAIKVRQAQKEREIIAIEKQARSNERLTKSAQQYTDALKRNTDAVKYRRYRNDAYYNLPEYYYQRPRWQSNHPVYDPSKRKNGLDMDIKMK